MCEGCERRENVVVFELCTHPSSEYAIAGKVDFHTIGHMRRGACGSEARLFAPAKTVLGS